MIQCLHIKLVIQLPVNHIKVCCTVHEVEASKYKEEERKRKRAEESKQKRLVGFIDCDYFLESPLQLITSNLNSDLYLKRK